MSLLLKRTTLAQLTVITNSFLDWKDSLWNLDLTILLYSKKTTSHLTAFLIKIISSKYI